MEILIDEGGMNRVCAAPKKQTAIARRTRQQF